MGISLPGNSDNNDPRNFAPSTFESEWGPLRMRLNLASSNDAETTSAPTVKDDSEKDLDDSDLPQTGYSDHRSNSIESLCFDGDLLLNIRCSGRRDSIAPPIIVGLRVSSVILRIASTPLRKLLDTPGISSASVQSKSGFVIHQHSGHDPHLWGYREGKGTFSLVVNSSIPMEDLKQGMLLVFKILHHSNKIRQCSTPTLLQVSWIAEIAWVLQCVGPVVPWIKSWLLIGRESSVVAVDAEVQLVSRVILGFVLGDSEVFKHASRQWLFCRMTETIDKWERLSLVVLSIINADLQEKRADLTRALRNTVSSTLTEYSQYDTCTFVLGAILRSLEQLASTKGFGPHCNLNSDDPQVQVSFIWQLATDNKSIHTLISKFYTITSGFNSNLTLWDRDKVVEKFANKIVVEFDKVEGLKLADYRAPAIKMVDLDSFIEDIAVKDDWEFQELKRYARGDYGGVIFWLANSLVDDPEQLIRSFRDYTALLRMIPTRINMDRYIGVVASTGERCLLEFQKLKIEARLRVLQSWITTHVLAAMENLKGIDSGMLDIKNCWGWLQPFVYVALCMVSVSFGLLILFSGFFIMCILFDRIGGTSLN